MLRIDDTDETRSTVEFEVAIREDLRWMGMQWDEEDRQSARLARYDEALKMLWQVATLILAMKLKKSYRSSANPSSWQESHQFMTVLPWH